MCSSDLGLAGHTLELARGAKMTAVIEWAKVPFIENVQALAAEGYITGASGRNWGGYGHDVVLPSGFGDVNQALLTDPQTSGGLLVSWAPSAVYAVLDLFRREGFESVAVVGRMEAGAGRLVVA